MNEDKLNPHDEQAMDALLSEVLGQAGPPDLSARILARHQSSESGPVVVEVQESPPVRRKSSNIPIVVLSGIAALAASLLLVVWIRGDVDPGEQPIAANSPDPSQPSVDAVAQDDVSPKPVEDAVQPPKARPKPKAVPLVIAESGDDQPGFGQQPSAIETPPSVGQVEPIVLVSKLVDDEMHRYWNSVGVEPTEELAIADLQTRLRERLGVEIDQQALTSPEQLRGQLIDAEAALAVAQQWLMRVTEGGLARIDSDARARLVDQVAGAFQGTQRLDVLLARWFAGENEGTSDWYAALAASGRDSMTHRIAGLSMNVDLRCTRCHDALIEGSGRQEDYWSFASLIRQGVHRDRDGAWKVGEPKSSKPMFYELPDGRQRMVHAAVPTRWMGQQGNPPIEDVRRWSSQLVASPQFAKGVVNSLWKLMHDRPLKGGVVDTMTAPHSESLDRLEEFLVADLLGSDFDVSRSLALIVHSPSARRSVPTALQADNALLASDAELWGAGDIVGAFAGSMPDHHKPALNQRILLAMRTTGGAVPSIRQSDTINAQTNGSPSKGTSKPPRRSDEGSAGFPVAAKDLPVGWLESVKGYGQQVEHLGYLAGFSELPTDVRQAADAMKSADGISDELALHRVWWLLSP